MRKQVGTVNILEPRVYPRRPRKPDEQLTTADEFVQVDAGHVARVPERRGWLDLLGDGG